MHPLQLEWVRRLLPRELVIQQHGWYNMKFILLCATLLQTGENCNHGTIMISTSRCARHWRLSGLLTSCGELSWTSHWQCGIARCWGGPRSDWGSRLTISIFEVWGGGFCLDCTSVTPGKTSGSFTWSVLCRSQRLLNWDTGREESGAKLAHRQSLFSN